MAVSIAHPFDLSDRALTLGDGVFDTCLVVDGRVMEAERHLERLGDACLRLGYGIGRDELASCYLSDPSGSGLAVLRVTVTGGPGARGLRPPETRRPNVLVSQSPWAWERLFPSVTLASVSIRRNETSPTSRLKTIGYLDNVAALGEALAAGSEEALMLNTRGAVACVSVGNVFAVVEGVLLTPPVSDGALPGVIRGRILDLAKREGISHRIATLAPATLRAAEAAFCTNSLRLISEVRAIDGVPLGGAPELIGRLKASFPIRLAPGAMTGLMPRAR